MSPSPGTTRPRRPSNRYPKGRGLKLNRQVLGGWKQLRAGSSSRKLNRLRNMPNSRWRRILWRLEPVNLKDYWWSREGLLMAIKVGGIGILSLFLLTIALFAYYRKNLANIKDLSGNIGGSISYYDRTGKTLLFSDYNGIKRVPVASTDISQYMKQATVATEDRGFYSEPGFSPKGIARAAINDLVHHGAQQGGSTITEQLVKMTEDWTQSRTLAHKVTELILAVDMERTYSKDDILTGYLNAAPYGGVDYGVQVAASDYFHTSAKKLTLPQAAFLAAIPNSPSYYSPYGPYYDKQALKDRYDYVLDSMVATHYITQAQADAAKKVDVAGHVFKQQETHYAGIKDPYFVLAAKNQILSQVLNGEDNSTKVNGWKVITTMDAGLQDNANNLIKKDLPLIKTYSGDEAAFAAEDVKTGQMVALVGGVDFNAPGYGQINYAQWPISPGSSVKPYDYSTFINNNNAGAGSVLYDKVGPLPGYPCTNKGLPPPAGNGNCLNDYDFRSPGPLTLRYAIGGSRNIPAVKAMLSADPNDSLATDPLRTKSVNDVIQTADGLMAAPNAYQCFSDNAMTKPTQCYGSAAIGDGAFLHLDQHVNGLASLARLGQAIPQTYILSITDANGKNVYTWQQPKATQVVRPDAAYIVDDMLSDPRASYLFGSCTDFTCPAGVNGVKWQRYNGWHIAVKTGTTGNNQDGVMTSWNTQYAAGMWVGYHTRSRALTIANDILTEPVLRPWMQSALDGLHTKPINWAKPSDIQTLPAYVIRSHAGFGSQEPSPTDDIFPAWYKPRSSGTAASGTIDKVSGKIATDCTPADAKETFSGNSAANLFSVDIFYGAGIATNSTSSGQDDVHLCSDTSPSISNFNVTPIPGSPGHYNISATAVAGTHPLTGSSFGGTISFAVDGATIGTVKMSSNGSAQLNYTNTKYSGSHTVTATATDSVLYQTTSSQSVSFNKALKFVSAVYGGGTLTVSWSGGVGPYTASVGALSCTAPAGSTKCSITAAPPSDSVTVQDSAGETASGSY